jgi:hypothetical protein
MSTLNRRSFLGKSSLAVAVGGAATAIPGLGTVLQLGVSNAPEVDDALTESEIAASESSPVVAHVTDLQAGEIRLYQGERMVIYRDPTLANRLFRAAR